MTTPRRSERWLVPVVALAAVSAWVAGAISGTQSGPPGHPLTGAQIALIAAGALFTALAAGLPLRQRRRAEQARDDAVVAAAEARAAMRVALEDTLDPLVHLLGSLATARGAARSRLQGEAIASTLAAVAGLTDAQRVRVCFYTLDPGRTDRLRPDRFSGRAGAPTVVFSEGTPEGDAALALARGAAWLYLADTRAQPPPFWWDEEHAYRTVLAGPVAAGAQVHGLLTLDALGPGELAHVDVTLIRLLATLLAIALSV